MTFILVIAFLTWFYWVLWLTWYLIEVLLFWDDYYKLLVNWWHCGLREEA